MKTISEAMEETVVWSSPHAEIRWYKDNPDMKYKVFAKRRPYKYYLGSYTTLAEAMEWARRVK